MFPLFLLHLEAGGNSHARGVNGVFCCSGEVPVAGQLRLAIFHGAFFLSVFLFTPCAFLLRLNNGRQRGDITRFVKAPRNPSAI